MPNPVDAFSAIANFLSTHQVKVQPTEHRVERHAEVTQRRPRVTTRDIALAVAAADVLDVRWRKRR